MHWYKDETEELWDPTTFQRRKCRQINRVKNQSIKKNSFEKQDGHISQHKFYQEVCRF